MPEGVGYGQSDAPVSAGLDIHYVKDYIYAYSGAVSANATLTSLVDFRTGNHSVRAFVVPMYMGSIAESDDYLWRIKLNGILIAEMVLANNIEVPNTDMILILPPLTNVQIQAKNLTENEAHDVGCIVTGKII